ncbi:MAG: PAS domain S-box protein [Desulfobacula sp.]|jgi:PAS domain S-box-containing protein|nr:PAS domain S-box protein [Desulfobacula sp.]
MDKIFEDIVETIHAPLLVLDSDLKVILANQSFYYSFKVKPEETIGQIIYDLGNKQWDIPKLRELLETILPEKTSFDKYEVEHDFATIGRRIMLLNARQIERAMGKERIILLAIENITDRKLLEGLLEESEERYRRLFETADDGILLLEKRKGNITHVNPSITEMLGYTKKECIGKKLKDIGFSLVDDYIQDILQKLNKDGIIHHNDVLIQPKGEHAFYADIYMVDKASLVQFNVRDVTERKQAEESLRESNEKFHSMADNIIIGVSLISPTMEILELNRQMHMWFPDIDPSMHPICYRAFNNPPRDEICVYCPTCRTFQDGKVHEATSVKPTADGPRNYRIVSSPILDAKGKVTAAIEMVEDVTERISLEAKLQQAQKMESIGTLAGGIAHDFNNILFPILGYAEILLMNTPEDSPIRKSLNQIYTSALRAKSLVTQILTFSRQESHELILMKMQPIIKEALKLIRSSIPTTIEIIQDINPDCGLIKADPTQIHQIVMNLSTNAYHAMKDTGGELKVSLKEMEFGTLDLINPNMAPGVYAWLTVADTGMGMDKNLTDKIFDPFFTTKAIGKGTGMGLSVVHGIVVAMGGAIHVYSEPGKGTEFHVYLPVEKSLSEKQATTSKAQIQGGTEKLLLVDDEEAILTMEKQMLERLGYQVTSRTSSLEALETFRDSPNKFDLVITDMAMPNMPGDRLSVELTKIRHGIPVLLCTGFSENMSEEKAASLGIKGFLFKPIVMKDLAQKIREVLDEN